jgi:polysaccharide biosynthesis/export protein
MITPGPAGYDGTVIALPCLALLLAQAVASPAPPPAADADYLIGQGDILQFSVFGHDDLSQALVVQPDGSVTFPLVGRIAAGGKSTRDLAAQLANLLGRSYVREPQVTITVREYRSKTVLVAGEVAHPGSYPLASGATIVEILARAGPVSGGAAAEAIVVRPRGEVKGPVLPSEMSDADVDVLRVNLREIESGNLQANLALRPNDTVFIPQAPRIYVSGEVKSPGAYPFSPGMTVRQLVILAGGLTEDGSSTRIRAIRKGEDGKAREVKIQMDDLVVLGDTLLVKAKLF